MCVELQALSCTYLSRENKKNITIENKQKVDVLMLSIILSGVHGLCAFPCWLVRLH